MFNRSIFFMRAAAFAAVSVLGASLFEGRANGAVLLNDTFDTYSTGNLIGQGGWTITGASVTNPIQVVNSSGSNKASLAATGQDGYKAFSGQQISHTDGASAETSLTVNVASVSAAGDYFSHLADVVGTTTNFYQRLAAKSSGTGYVLGLESTSGGASAAFTYGTLLPFGTDENVDIVWNFVPGLVNDTFDVTVNGSPYLSAVPWLSTSAEPPQLQEANLRQGTGGPVVTVDNYEVQGAATQTPEPTSMGLVVAASGLLLARRPRRA